MSAEKPADWDKMSDTAKKNYITEHVRKTGDPYVWMVLEAEQLGMSVPKLLTEG